MKTLIKYKSPISKTLSSIILFFFCRRSTLQQLHSVYNSIGIMQIRRLGYLRVGIFNTTVLFCGLSNPLDSINILLNIEALQGFLKQLSVYSLNWLVSRSEDQIQSVRRPELVSRKTKLSQSEDRSQSVRRPKLVSPKTEVSQSEDQSLVSPRDTWFLRPEVNN